MYQNGDMEMNQKEDLLQRISSDPNVCFGRPVIRNTRIWVSVILNLFASGLSEQEILMEYPQLTPEDIRAACAYGSLTVDESQIPLLDQ